MQAPRVAFTHYCLEVRHNTLMLGVISQTLPHCPPFSTTYGLALPWKRSIYCPQRKQTIKQLHHAPTSSGDLWDPR
eukprot:6021198-Pyramimonas_sp.AAC.1